MGEKTRFLGSLILAGSVCIAGAQTTPVNMSGMVSDVNTGNPVVGAAVTLTNNPSLTATTDAQGNFHITGEAAVGIRSKAATDKQGMSLKGTALSLSVLENNTPVAIDVFNLKSEHVRTVLDQNLNSGRYNVNVASSELPGGLYIVRARVGNKSSSFKVTAIGPQAASADLFNNALFTRTTLAKSAADVIDDTLKVTKTGYRMNKKAITSYNTIYPVILTPGLVAGDLKIVSERNIPQVDWGGNVDVQVWDASTQLKGDYKPSPFEGTQSWLVNFLPGQSYSAWGFVTKAMPEDMSAWKGGTMHIAVKGTASSIGLTMASADQGSGSSVKVNLADYGYRPLSNTDTTTWHDVAVPLDAFVGTDLSQITTYCGLVYPVEGDTVPFSSSMFYQVDDIYWSLKK